MDRWRGTSSGTWMDQRQPGFAVARQVVAGGVGAAPPASPEQTPLWPAAATQQQPATSLSAAVSTPAVPATRARASELSKPASAPKSSTNRRDCCSSGTATAVMSIVPRTNCSRGGWGPASASAPSSAHDRADVSSKEPMRCSRPTTERQSSGGVAGAVVLSSSIHSMQVPIRTPQDRQVEQQLFRQAMRGATVRRAQRRQPQAQHQALLRLNLLPLARAVVASNTEAASANAMLQHCRVSMRSSLRPKPSWARALQAQQQRCAGPQSTVCNKAEGVAALLRAPHRERHQAQQGEEQAVVREKGVDDGVIVGTIAGAIARAGDACEPGCEARQLLRRFSESGGQRHCGPRPSVNNSKRQLSLMRRHAAHAPIDDKDQ
ncbi:hypothetical protein TSOC_004053 [Tetrabaena socialis]|uniref:Uncharacterized protein n=1 Tax=Tetrabaena socialis TaxID=47790 RepID=A0A2J8A9Z2_9CHLO|nr:hypothetical protein TSOC_004053 [Tetrabaena socialis]|eukprot:PNH09329.1 hypothetical protein TSOC_004053 [Tetrabaena socialis]